MRFVFWFVFCLALLAVTAIIILDPNGFSRPAYKACVAPSGNTWKDC